MSNRSGSGQWEPCRLIRTFWDSTSGEIGHWGSVSRTGRPRVDATAGPVAETPKGCQSPVAYDDLVRRRQGATMGIQRERSFGQSYELTPVDRFGVWLSTRSVQRWTGDLDGKRIGDFGCGYEARTARQLLPTAASVLLIDVALADDLKATSTVQAIEGPLPAS